MKKSALAALVALGLATSAQAKEFTWSFQKDAQSLDPYVLNETFTLGFLGNIYEGLIRRAPDLSIQPALAESWEILEPTRWRFHLRKGVKFHNGNAFTADDVVFSAKRVRADGSDLKTRLPDDTQVVKVDDYTVDFITGQPNPILVTEWANWYIMDKEWSEEHDAVAPSSVTEGKDNYAAFNANGTGPFRVVKRETDVETIMEPYAGWWDTPKHNLTKVVFKPISSDPTRVAALLSGSIDMAYPIPVQDINRVERNEGTGMLTGPELRTIFLGLNQSAPELGSSNIKGKNPLADVRVREAMYRAIDIEAIKRKVMRNLSEPSALMISPQLVDKSAWLERLPFDPDKAKALMAEAGYADGFSITLDCPNNRYVNDEKICTAVVGMLAKIGIKVNLLAQPMSIYAAKVLGPKYDTDFYLLGWTPGSFDSWNVLYNLIRCRGEGGAGKFNLGNYCDPRIGELTDKILSETDIPKRNAMIAEAFKITNDDRGYIPLHQQGLAWGKRDTVELAQRADNQFMLYYVTVQ
ncbi:MAG: ABC transporter substrate-binding protein [Alphaproteobacteria bacterium]|nr:ABC transporter substrate-binding protein [Alphaproteobacteria bacterium]MCB9928557.1 ABC transporter substrate-binding protein [Alphaproteobacteria bacterium]